MGQVRAIFPPAVLCIPRQCDQDHRRRRFVEELLVIAAAFLVVGLFYVFLFLTTQGRAIRAVAFNRETAALLGIDVTRTTVLVFVIASVLAAISGILVGPIVTV